MNRSKIAEFFEAEDVKEQINVIGTGAIGSAVCESLARIGCAEVHIWDFDKVEAHNITNQMFKETDIGSLKTEACKQMMQEINPLIKVFTHNEGLQEPYLVSGYVFMCVDNIELRKKIVEINKYNPATKAIFDFRMRLTDAQYYCATNEWQYEQMLKTMEFTHEEAIEATPRSACGVELSVVYAPRTIVNFGIANFIKLVKQSESYSNMVTVDMDTFEVQSYHWKERKKKTQDILSMLGI